MTKMITVDEAANLIAQNLPIWKTKKVPLENSIGKILAQEICSEREQPPFNRMMMDGIAFEFESFQKGQRSFPIQDMQRAGEAQKKLVNSTDCFEGMTGGVLPEGCDCVIRYEDIEIVDGVANIASDISATLMQNVHAKGIDHHKGDLLLDKGQRLSGPQIGIIASNGLSEIEVFDTPKIAVISTGDELVDFGQYPLAHQIRRSNPYALKAELNAFGLEKIDLFHLQDDPEEIMTKLQEILISHDVLVLSGAVSMGKYDFLPQAFSDLKINKVFHKVTQRPGKPFWYGTKEVDGQRKAIYALPGNPISCLVGLRRYVVGSIFQAMERKTPSRAYATLTRDFVFKKDLTYFLPITFEYDQEGRTLATPLPTNGSGDYGALGPSQGMIELPRGRDLFKKGESFPLYIWGADASKSL
jgi:molybdopterin molybdotransferase